MTRHPIKRMVTCVICGARRRTDAGRIVTVSTPTRYVKDKHTSVLVVDGAQICWFHETVAQYAATEARYGRTP